MAAWANCREVAVGIRIESTSFGLNSSAVRQFVTMHFEPPTVARWLAKVGDSAPLGR